MYCAIVNQTSSLWFDDCNVQPFLSGIVHGVTCTAALLFVVDSDQVSSLFDHIAIALLKAAVVVVMTNVLNLVCLFKNIIVSGPILGRPAHQTCRRRSAAPADAVLG